MTSSIRSLNPFDHIKNTYENIKRGDYTQAVVDPGDVVSQGEKKIEEDAEQAERDAVQASLDEQAAAQAQTQANTKAAAASAKKRKRSGTQTVLTSPLGSTETARTAVAKLGGY